MRDNLENFYTFIQNNQQLQEQLAAAPDQESFTEMAVRLGKENGYTFTAEDVNNFINQKRQEANNAELSIEDLQAVAGGKSCPLDTRFTACFLVSGCWGSKC